MDVLKQLQAWISANVHHRIVLAERLPDPTFTCEGRKLVSFSTNNYLGLATCDRMVQAARRGIEAFGVGNCESRILGGDLEIYRELESRLARLKGKPVAMIFATGYLTNLGVLSALPQIPLLARFYGYRGRRHSYAYFTDEFNHLSIREGKRGEGRSDRHLDGLGNRGQSVPAGTSPMYSENTSSDRIRAPHARLQQITSSFCG